MTLSLCYVILLLTINASCHTHSQHNIAITSFADTIEDNKSMLSSQLILSHLLHLTIELINKQSNLNVSSYRAKLLFHQSPTRHSDCIGSDGVVTLDNCWYHTAIGSSVTMLPAINNGEYTVTVQSLCGHCA